MAAFAKAIIKPPSFCDKPPQILKNMKYSLLFKDCIAIINGTQIPVVVPTSKAVLYRSGRKNECTQNVMIVCIRHAFHADKLSWEGSVNDWRMFTEATTRPNINFPHPPQGICRNSLVYALQL